MQPCDMQLMCTCSYSLSPSAEAEDSFTKHKKSGNQSIYNGSYDQRPGEEHDK